MKIRNLIIAIFLLSLLTLGSCEMFEKKDEVKEETKVEETKNEEETQENKKEDTNNENTKVKKTEEPLNFDGMSADDLNSKGVEFFSSKDYKKSLSYYNEALKKSPNNALYNYNKGLALYFDKNYEGAVKHFTIAINNDDGSSKEYLAESYSHRGASYYELFKDKEAMKDLDKALELNSNDFWGLYYKAEELRIMKKYDEALEYINKYIELKETNASAFAIKGDILYAQKKDNLSAEAYKKAVEIDPMDSNSMFYLGHISYYAKDLQKAFDYYKKAADISPSKYLNNFYAGYIAYRLGDMENAKTYLAKALQDEKGKLDEAVKLYGLAITDNDGNEEQTKNFMKEFYPEMIDKKDDILKLKVTFENDGYNKLVEELGKMK